MQPTISALNHSLDLLKTTVAIAFASLANLAANADFSIAGKLPEVANGSLQLLREDLDERNRSLEARIPVNSDGSFSSQVQGPAGVFYLQLPSGQSIPLAIDANQSLEISGLQENPSLIAVSGSPDTEAFQAYEAFRKDSLNRLVYPPRAALNAAKDAGNVPADRMAELSEAEVQGYLAHRRELNDFTIEKVGNSIALYATSLRWDGDHRISELEALFQRFAKRGSDLAIAKSMANRLERFRRTAIGAEAASLAGRSLAGDPLNLSDYQGRFVLVDFWASWCVPCRVENRHYIGLREKYTRDQFEVFGVNLDDSEVIWSMASKRDRVSWPQISDFQGLNSPMAKAYNVSALPMSFLLDGEGRIISRNLRGEQLAQKLEELLGK